MPNKNAEDVVRNVGAMAETAALFYTTVARQVAVPVALELTKHFMSLTIQKPQVPAAVLHAAVLSEATRIAEEKKRQEPPAPPQAEAPKAPETPGEPEKEQP